MTKKFFETSFFHEVQMSKIFEDGKTFVDAIPKSDLDQILFLYESEHKKPEFDLKDFTLSHFEIPKEIVQENHTVKVSIIEHIEQLWNTLKRNPDEKNDGSLLHLPHSYIVPGGRFREIYYWDSYFTMLGLKESGEVEIIENMVENFAYLIHQHGFIPNGNRTYYLSRSQPPFFGLMVELLASIKGDDVLLKYLPALETEWNFWNNTEKELRNISIGKDNYLLRYFDHEETPRPESYAEDVGLSHQSNQPNNQLFRHLRAAAESGWDFSTRWFEDETAFSTIHTTDIIPIDLNSLNYQLTSLLSKTYKLNNQIEKGDLFEMKANKIKENILNFMWSNEYNFFMDYDFKQKKSKNCMTLAATFPLFVGIATQTQAQQVAAIIENMFLKKGGLITTLIHSGQQWDAPNGWAPLQWMAYIGLKNYGFYELANEIKRRWMETCEAVFDETGKLTEKYDVTQPNSSASGGEYPNQDGFGWTNGVYLAMWKN